MGGCLNINDNETKDMIISNNKKNLNFNKNEIKHFDSIALKLHNEYRKKHNASELELDKDLSKKAQKKLYELINEENERIDSDDNDFGENLYIGIDGNINVEEACNSWYNEKTNYNYELNKYQNNSAHFTQMIWKGTKKVGFGYSKLNKGNSYFIALYSPPGNDIFEFKNNVEKSFE